MLNDVPAALKQHPNWVVWKYVTKDGRPTKVPFNVNAPGQYAKADDATTWATFDKAAEAADPLGGGDYEGVGFELGGTDIVGIDFDNAIDKKGVVDPYVLAILMLLGNPYTETSPSGTGLHAFVECDALPAGGRKMSQGHVGIEIYHGREGGRYFTITGHRVLGDGVPRIQDITLAYLLISQNKDKRFKALWLGDTSYYDGDDSSADFNLLRKLAVLTKNDAAAMEAAFSMSGLGARDKWIERDDYRERSIKAAIETNVTGKVVSPVSDIEFNTPSVPDPPGDYVINPPLGQKDGWFPLGDISLIGGASGTGKTTLIFQMLFAQKEGQVFLGHGTNKYVFHVLAYDRGKNAFTRTLERMNMLASDIPTTALPLAFGTDAVQSIILEIEKMNPRPQVVYLEGLDMLIEDTNKKSQVAPFMRKLQEVAAHFHIALIGSLGAPKTKRGEDYAAKRDHLSGSEAWGRNCETVMVLEFTEEDDGTAKQRSLSVLPRNAAAEKFTMEFQGGKLVQVEAIPEAESAPGTHLRPAVQSAVSFLQDALQDGPKPMKTLMRDARDFKNITRPTLFAAAEFLRVDTTAVVHGTPVWSLKPVYAGTTQEDEHDAEPPLEGDFSLQ